MKVKRKAFITSIIVMLSTLLIGFIGWGLTTHSFERIYKRTIVSKNYIEVNSFIFSDLVRDVLNGGEGINFEKLLSGIKIEFKNSHWGFMNKSRLILRRREAI